MNCSIDQKADVVQLCETAINYLAPMFSAETQMFCHRRKLTPEGLVNEGSSPRYTAMTVLGLLEAEAAGFQHSFEVERIWAALIAGLEWAQGVGDRGLLLWLCARISPRQLDALWSKLDIQHALQQARDARQGMTTELAWLLTGISEAALAMTAERSRFYPAASQVYEMVKRNQGPAGLFGHLAKGSSPTAALRSSIGCFADQVYPIIAFTQFAVAFQVEAALALAQKCGTAICELQGEQGQWWWHYDAAQGKVFGRYPVFSVHQHGMAPMALFLLQKATGQDFSSAIYKGLDWVYGNNELGQDMRDASRQIIWRSIYDGGRYARYLAGGLSLLGLRNANAAPGKLQIKYECRPYELGWLLFAFAGQTSGVAHRAETGAAKLLSTV